MDGRVGRADVKLREEPMKSLSELAGIYERLAKANEATAEEIMSSLDSLPTEVREQAAGAPANCSRTLQH